jgi:hypothetical protein
MATPDIRTRQSKAKKKLKYNMHNTGCNNTDERNDGGDEQ